MMPRARLWVGALLLCCAGAAGQLPPLSEATANNQGIALLEQHQFQKAVEVYEAALEKHPRSVTLLVNLAIARFHTQDYAAALELLDRAAALETENPFVHFNRGLIYKNQGEQEKAVTAFETVTRLDPRDPTSFYNLGVLQLRMRNYRQAITALEQALALERNNLAAYFNLGMAYLRGGSEQEGKRYLDLFQQLQKAAPDMEPMGVGQQYTELGRYSLAIESTPVAGARSAAQPAAGWRDSFFSEEGAAWGLTAELFAGSQASSAGPPSQLPDAGGATAEHVDAQLAPWLGYGAAAADYDGDGRVDLLLARTGAAGNAGRVLLLRNESGNRFKDAGSSLPRVPRRPMAAVFGDYDNDGLADLYLSGAGEGVLLRRTEAGAFEERTGPAGIPALGFATAAGWVDYDHDGDLDLAIARYGEPEQGGGLRPASPVLLRNNGNGTFADVTVAAGLAAVRARALGLLFSDVDDDRDVDLLLAGDGPPGTLFLNERNGTFKVAGAGAGLPAAGAGPGAAAADTNADGRIDLFFPRESGDLNLLLVNQGGDFLLDSASPALLAAPSRRPAVRRTGSLFADLDNDGDPDLVLASESAAGAGGVIAEIFENRAGRFEPWVRLANPDPARAVQPRGVLAADFDNDGLLDLLFHDRLGRPLLFRNRHPAPGRWLKLNPSGLRSNKSGFGTRIEVRAGLTYQKIELSSTAGYLSQSGLPVHIGLGRAEVVDRLRLLWPTGVVQGEAGVAAGQTLRLEELNRKGTSCPLLYGWDGRQFRFLTDFLGGSAVGYQVAPGVYSRPDSDEYIRIEGERLRPSEGRLLLRMNNQLEEVLFFDQAELVAVDHPAGTDVYPNERLMPGPPFPEFRVHQVAAPRPPERAWVDGGRDVTDAVRRRDRRWPEGFRLLPFKGYAEPHELVLDFGDTAGARRGVLLLHAWIDYADSSANVAAAQAGAKLTPPYLQVQEADGSWTTALESMGFPAGLPKTMTVDVGSLLPRPRLVLRIVTSMRIYWDQVLLDTSEPGAVPVLTRLAPLRAELRFKGYPQSWSADGRPPAAYLYDRARPRESWRTHRGAYTRFGDVRELLLRRDDRFVITRHGDEVALEFDARAFTRLPRGWKRDYFFYADGFGKDMDLNSAFPDTVEPLPFHGMQSYPHAAGEQYPDSAAHREYLARFNTRRVLGIYEALEELRRLK